jgi:exodeoxyribonuclease III
VRVATWNVNSLNARWDRLVGFLARRDVDILLVQETKMKEEVFPFEEIANLGYEAAHFGQGQWNGVAVLSRVGLTSVTRGLYDDPEARFIGATCGDLRVYSCYVPNGRALDNPHFTYKLDWLTDLRRYLATEAPRDGVVVGGDFNVAPTDFDVHDPAAFVGATHVSPEERAKLADLAADGWCDITRTLRPDEPCFSWWDYRQGGFRRNHGLRIDLLWCSPDVAARATDSWVDREERGEERPSDHAPVMLDLR